MPTISCILKSRVRHCKSKALEQFQNNSKERILLLNVMDESASGANLTSANHAIFLSPLLAPSQEIYTACETQAVGRLVRYGQTKHVTVWRYLTKDTIDEEIYEQRKWRCRHKLCSVGRTFGLFHFMDVLL